MIIVNHIINYLTFNDIRVLHYKYSNIYEKINFDKVDDFFINYKKLKFIMNRLNSVPIVNYNVIHLNLGFNNIKKIENLSEGLKSLILHSNIIEKIENLPNSIRILNLGINSITKLENLPCNLKYLIINNNFIEILENLPKDIEYISFENNYIKLKDAYEYLQNINLRGHTKYIWMKTQYFLRNYSKQFFK